MARRAEHLEDLASALDAGLGAEAALHAVIGSEAGLAGGLAAALGRAFPSLDPAARAALDAAETTGQLPDALREQADADRSAVALRRDVAHRLAYPAFLIVAATALAGWLALLGVPAVPPSLVLAFSVALAAIAAGVTYAVRRARRDPALDLTRLPIVGRLAGDLAAVPYLTAMRRTHRAGVPIDAAHRLAARTCPLAHQRGRLVAASTRLEARSTYVEALRSTSAMDEETLALLDVAEQTGDLESALGRAAQRRRERFERDAKRLAVLVGSAIYGLAVLLVVWIVLGFYGNLYRRL